MGKSLGGVSIPLLKITNPQTEADIAIGGSPFKCKPVVVVIGRQHSGETHSSFIIHGMINFLLMRDVFAHKLRELFEWWVLPIVNPDGVITGNYRSNLQGKDMNRHFFSDEPDDPDARNYGRCHEVELLRDYLKENVNGNLKMFLDIHAHSI